MKIVFLLLALSIRPLQAETLVEQLLARYAQIETVTCDVRRDLSNDDGSMRWLSRVYYARPDRLHVENFAPLPRRIIADGHTMYQHNDGQARGFRRAITDLNEPMLHALHKVPGTVMEHLFRLQGVEEEILEGTPNHPLRRAYHTETLRIILGADESLRLKQVEIFDAHNPERRTGRIELDAFEEVMEGVWIPMRHRGWYQLGGLESRETTRISNYTANQDIPDHLFDATAYFREVQTWVDRFDHL